MKSSATLLLLSSLFTAGHATAATGSFTSSASISIPAVTTTFTPATPYPSSLNVSGLPGGISRMTVTLNGFSHTWPSDVDIMLVAPDGTSAIIFSDVGGDIDANSLTLTLDDSSPALLPSSSALTSGTYRPTNVGSGDVFNSPAPSPNSNVLLSSFNGISPNGTWNLYVMDASVGDGGSIAGWTLNIETAATASEGDLVISEFRVRGSNGANDEFVEIQNVTDTDILVMASSGTGYALAASDGVARFIIPNNTIIPAGGHYLGTNSVGYSLGGHATGNATWTTDIPDNAGIALFRTSIGANFTLANRLDAVGSTSEPNTLYKRGTGYRALTPFNIDCSFTRDERGGFVRDTLNNEKDFLFVDTNGTSAGAGQRLGAPGPQNLSSPIRKSTGPAITRRLVDSNAAFNAPPNRVRDFTSVPASNSTFGTLGLARRFTNNSGAPITRLRFRITDLSTFPTPSQVTDLRPRSAPSLVVDRVVGGQVLLQSTTLEQPPTQPNGGGFNSTLSVGSITQGAPLANGATVDVRFLLGLQSTGRYWISMVAETLPPTASGMWILSGDTENASLDAEVLAPAQITNVRRLASDVSIDHFCPTGTSFQLQRSTTLANWIDVGSAIPGTGLPGSFTQTGGAAFTKQFFRLKEIR